MGARIGVNLSLTMILASAFLFCLTFR